MHTLKFLTTSAIFCHIYIYIASSLYKNKHITQPRYTKYACKLIPFNNTFGGDLLQATVNLQQFRHTCCDSSPPLQKFKVIIISVYSPAAVRQAAKDNSNVFATTRRNHVQNRLPWTKMFQQHTLHLVRDTMATIFYNLTEADKAMVRADCI